MSRTFYATSSTERKRRKRDADRERILAAALESSSDDTSDNHLDASLQSQPLPHDSIDLNNLLHVDQVVTQQRTVNQDCNSSNNGEDDTDLDELFPVIDINYQNKVYADSNLSLYDACKQIITLCRRLNLDKKKSEILLQSTRSLLPNDNKLPRTLHGMMKILGW